MEGTMAKNDTMAALGELICRLNPYTELPVNQTTGQSTGEMEVATLPGTTLPIGETGAEAGEQSLIGNIARMGIEVEDNYGSQWSFKGQTQAVKTAVKIPYRFPVKKNGKVLYWRTEYLLIGYAGAEGGG
jgi:hypothetical protein